MENPFKPKLFNPKQKRKIEDLTNAAKSDPDVIYKRDKDPERIENIQECLKNPKIIEMEFKGQQVQLEYIEVPAKKKGEGKEKVMFMLPGFSASYKPFKNTVKELAQYCGDYRIICISPLDSGESSSLKGSNLEKMTNVYFQGIESMGVNHENSELTVVGHSRSDIIAINMAVSRPDLVKNTVIANGIIANDSDLKGLSSLGGLTKDFLVHVNTKITPARIIGAFKDDKEAATNYWKTNVDFFKNILQPRKAWNQFKSLTERDKVDQDYLLSKIKANMLVINSTEEFTPWDKTREKVYQRLPENIQKQHRIEFGGLHDEIFDHPEAFAIKFKRWSESIN
jgi:pimeloyl-ACP methyl ester carboxylesterase